MAIHRPEGQSAAWYHGFDWATDANAEAEELDNVEYAESKDIDFMSSDWDEFAKGIDYAQLGQEEDRCYGS